MKKGFLTFSLIASSLVAIGVTAIFAQPKASRSAAAAPISRPAPSFDGEIEYVGSELSISAISCSETDFSTSYQISYSTGGNSLYDNAGGKFVYVLGYDTSEEGLIAYAEAFQKKDTDEQDRIQEEIAAGLATTPVFSGYIFQFNSNQENVFIPETISRGEYAYNSAYDVEIDAIGENAFRNNSVVKNLYIPSTIETIPSSALALAPYLTDIYVEATSKPDGWEEGWNCGATVHWGEDIYSYAPSISTGETYRHSSTTSMQKVGNDDYNYIFGYVPADQSKGHYPLTVEYKLVGDTETKWVEIEKSNEHGDYDSVGGKIGTGSSSNLYTNSFYIDIEIAHGQEVDFDSIVIHNFFEADSAVIEGVITYFPKEGRRFYASPAKVFSKTSHLQDYATLQFNDVAGFAGYTSVTASLSKTNKGIDVYKAAKPYYYNIYENNIKSGRAVIRYRLTQLGKATFIVETSEGKKEIKPNTPIIQYIIRNDQGNNLGFVFKDSALGFSHYNIKDVKSFAVRGMTLTIDIVNDGVILKTTASRARFGMIYIKNPTDTQKTFSADLFLILFAVGYTAGALILSSVLFLVFKSVYKNDEFRRLKPKQFIKKAIIYWATSLAVALAIIFVVLRCSVFANAIVVYNPLDVFIIIFGIATIIIVGYYIKNLVASSKASKQRKKAIKLGMVNEVADDGTK